METVCLSWGLFDVSHSRDHDSRPNPPSWTAKDRNSICLSPLHPRLNRLLHTWCCRLPRRDILRHNRKVACRRRLLDHRRGQAMALRRLPILRCNIRTICNGHRTGQRDKRSPRGSFLPLPLPLLWRRQTSSPTVDRLCQLGGRVGLLQHTSRKAGHSARASEYLHSICIPFLRTRIRGP